MRKVESILVAVMAAAVSGSIGVQAQSMMTRHVRQALKNGKAQVSGHLPASQVLNLDIVLPLRDPAGLDNFLTQLNDSTSPFYRHYLTPAEFSAKFGPSQSDYDAVVQYAQTHGLTVTGGTLQGSDVQVKGTVGAVESAFHVNMQTYKHPTENRDFYSPDREPTTDLSFNLWHISGMDNYSIPQPMLEKRSDFAAAHGISSDAVVSHATTGSGPSASFLGSDMRAAYYGSGPLTGAGQNLALLEYYGTDLADLQTYYKNIGQTYPGSIIQLLSVDGTSTSCVYSVGRCDDTEQTLDMTQALGMAPGLNSMVMYIGSTDTAILSRMVSPPSGTALATTIGCSWGWTPADPSTLDPYFKQMQAQGQTFLAASGDHSTWTASGTSEAWPADDAYIVSVGGTDLITSSANGPWQSETAWVDSGGGISQDGIAIPSWQQISGVINSSNHGSTTYRNGPDVSANANFTFYTCADQTTCQANAYGGTSFAAPMWAGYLALVNQQQAASGHGPVGFINPTIYQQNVGSQYATDFHDVTSGTSGSYSAVTGYDLVTGWGSPTPALVNALTGSTTQTPMLAVSASPTAVSVTADGTSTVTSTVTTSGANGFNSAVSLSASGVPSGVTVSFNPTSIAAPGSGSSSATFKAASGTAAGTYSITITATGGGLTQTTTVSLTVNAAQVGSFTLAASPSSFNLARRSTAATTISTAVTGGFNSTVSLSASAGGGLSVSFSPASITGQGSSTMNVTASKNAPLGTRTVTVTATGGGQTQTTTVTINVTR